MSLPVVLTPEAQAEFDDAFDWYENQRPGLGTVFAERVQDALDRISANPQLHATVFKDIRKAVVQRFPYSVYYRAETSRVLVIAVFHGRRDPSIWQARA
jgi:plasmid stabilization system protein ParE